MATARLEMSRHRLPLWAALAGLLPLLLLTLSGLGEGFPDPLLPGEVMVGMSVLAVALMPLLMWKGWMWGGLLIYSVMASFSTQAGLDDIASSYKDPYIILAALVVLLPALAFQFSAWRYRWIILLVGLFVALAIVGRIAGQYWDMVGRLNFDGCYPACVPVSGQQPVWWRVLLGLTG